MKEFTINNACIQTNYEYGHFEIICLDDKETEKLRKELEDIMDLEKPLKLRVIVED